MKPKCRHCRKRIEEDKLSKNLINDWLFEIEGFIEEIREEVKGWFKS